MKAEYTCNGIADKHGVMWRVHTKGFLERVLELTNTTNVMVIPAHIFDDLLRRLAKRCSELDDPILNGFMCRLALYAIADPESDEYDSRKAEEIMRRAAELEDTGYNPTEQKD